jgi:hypothetical protein
MKKTKIIVMAVATVVSQLAGVQSGSAQEFYKAFVNAVSISTNQEGNLIYHEFNNWNIISTVADEQGITNLTGLSLVYDRTADALEVVSGTNDIPVSTVLTFSGGVSLSNTNEIKIERLAGFIGRPTRQSAARCWLFDPVQVLKSCDCYEYQSCEHDGWEDSEARTDRLSI